MAMGDSRATVFTPVHYLLAFNTLVLALSFVPWFAGTPQALGVADRLFGHIRFGGFRFDIVWLVFSFFATFVWVIYNLSTFRQRSHKFNALLGALWCIGFVGLVRHILISGLLDMG
jgi:hypothetical protein